MFTVWWSCGWEWRQWIPASNRWPRTITILWWKISWLRIIILSTFINPFLSQTTIKRWKKQTKIKLMRSKFNFATKWIWSKGQQNDVFIEFQRRIRHRSGSLSCSRRWFRMFERGRLNDCYRCRRRAELVLLLLLFLLCASKRQTKQEGKKATTENKPLQPNYEAVHWLNYSVGNKQRAIGWA